MYKKTEAYIVAGRRTPFGSFNGSLSTIPAPQLGGVTVKAVIQDSGLDPAAIQDLYFGNVLSANLGQAPASQVAYYGGLPETTPCTLINKVCASGMKAIQIAAKTIFIGDNDLVIAGGMENMSLTPHYVTNYRTGYKYGHTQLLDGIARDGLSDAFSDASMGLCGEMCAERYEISREAQDEYAVRSYRLTLEAQKNGWFEKSICPVTVTGKKGESIIITEDEEPKNVKFEKIPQLKPAFKKDGGITAANSSKINDGAAATIIASEEAVKKYNLKPLARIISFADAALHPDWFTIANTEAVKKLLTQTNMTIDQIDLFEINEAFAVVVLANMQILGIPLEKVNIHGGAISQGHPIGASGTRIVIDLVHALIEKNLRYGIATICNGGGGASAILIERV
ncbi:MAG: thiolase family protein [Bacteroidia bacterium]|nr:thiolase family protein [Bacteroidia bacterium]MDW8158403.1 thiolase family protein [Bacteroidia bacterium]